MTPSRVAARRREDADAWERMRDLPEFGTAELRQATGMTQRRAAEILRSWEARQLVHERGVRKGGGRVYAPGVRPAGEAEARAAIAGEGRADPRRNMWRAMQLLGTFSPRELAAVSDMPEAPVSEASAQGYCQALLRGEYLRVIQKARPGHRPAIYLLARRTGPVPPVERRVAALWDPNLEQLTYVAGLGVTS